MRFLNWALLNVIVVCVGWGAFVGIRKLQRRFRITEQSLKFFQVIIAAVFFCVWIVALVSPVYYEFPTKYGVLYSIAEDGSLTEHPWGVFEHGKTLAWMPRQGEVVAKTTSAITPIAANPKVRRITYNASAYISDARAYLGIPQNREVVHPRYDTPILNDDPNFHGLRLRVGKQVQYCQYEFNNAHSSELAELYNPLDEVQQARFRELAGNSLNNCLRKHFIGVTVSDFSID